MRVARSIATMIVAAAVAAAGVLASA